jgi:L-alanine-DL-glutamate epimerase-like enolase superfamily enzyme
MKITRVETIVMRNVPTPRPLSFAWDPGEVTKSTSFIVIKVHADSGIVGYGHNYLTDQVAAAGSRLIGMDVFATEQHARILRKFHRAWGLETAIWDLIGKACGQPLYKLWGGYTDRIRGYASTIEVGTPEERAQDTLGFIEEGFHAIKLRLHNDTLAEDIALAKAVADAANGRMDLMADGNQAQTPVTPSSQSGVIWDLKRARYTARALEEMGFVWLEEPLSRYDYDGLASLNSSVDLAIAGGENNAYFHEYRTLLERNCYDILQPDALVSEGIGQLRKIAALAEVRAKLCVPHHGGGGICTYAHLHFSAGVPNSPWVEIMRDKPGEFPWPAALVPTVPMMVDKDGNVPLPSGPGIGINLDEDFIRKHAT